MLRRALLLCAVLICTAALAAQTTLYVSPTGNDAWTGASLTVKAPDGPLATIGGARDRVRALRAAGKADHVTVLLRGGTHYLPRTFVLHPQDSDVTYAAYRNEQPVLSGGEVLGGFRRVGNLYTTTVAGVAEGRRDFRQLWVNGQRRRPARSPNEGYYYVASKAPLALENGREVDRGKTAFVFKPGDLKSFPDLDQANVIVFHSWETSRLRIRNLDEASHTVTFTGPACWEFESWGKGQRYYVEYVREALDAPGEWYLDHQTGVLSYYPLPGEDPTKLQVVAPRLTRLVELQGEPRLGLTVSNVVFRGLRFAYEDFTLEPGGHSDPQAVHTAPAAIMADGAVGCVLQQCEIAHVGDYGLWLRQACKDNQVVQCRIHDTGIGALRIGTSGNPGADQLTASGNVIDNNHLWDGGHVYQGGVGLLVSQAYGNRISHNEIHDFTYSGMSIGWTWGDEDTRCRDNIIEFNHVHHVMNHILNDGGAIYTLGNSPGSVLRNNVLHDVWSYSAIGWGIYLDATTNRYTVENNLVYHTRSGALMYANGGHEHVIRNNIFAGTSEQMIWPYWEKRINTFERNIIYLTQGDLFMGFTERSLTDRLKAGEKPAQWDGNLYYNPNEPDLLFYGKTFAEWQALGLDQHSVLADPQFEDVKSCNFRLRSTSPAFALGFKQIDTSQVGLYGEPAWRREAQLVKHPPTALPPPPPPPAPQAVADDFEATLVGISPDLATTSGEEGTASIRVTDEQAAGGRHSLKIVDSAGLKYEWEPHFYYQPHFTEGKVRQSFDLRVEPGAHLYVEWRDTTPYPENVGPTITVLPTGEVSASGKALLKIAPDTWVHFQIDGEVGKAAPQTYTVTVTLPGGQPQRFEAIPNAGKQFRALHWLGLVSLAKERETYYVDNVRIEQVR